MRNAHLLTPYPVPHYHTEVSNHNLTQWPSSCCTAENAGVSEKWSDFPRCTVAGPCLSPRLPASHGSHCLVRWCELPVMKIHRGWLNLPRNAGEGNWHFMADLPRLPGQGSRVMPTHEWELIHTRLRQEAPWGGGRRWLLREGSQTPTFTNVPGCAFFGSCLYSFNNVHLWSITLLLPCQLMS